MNNYFITLGFLVAIIISGIILILYRNRYRGSTAKPFKDQVSPVVKSSKSVPCILCGTLLTPGKRMKSTALTAGDEKIVHLYGCPYCFGVTAVLERKCPLCHRILGNNEFMVGKMRNTGKGKPHLSIAGCSVCAFDKNV